MTGRASAAGDIQLCVAQDHSRVNCQGAVFIIGGNVDSELRGVLLRYLEKRALTIKATIAEQVEDKAAELRKRLDEVQARWESQQTEILEAVEAHQAVQDSAIAELWRSDGAQARRLELLERMVDSRLSGRALSPEDEQSLKEAGKRYSRHRGRFRMAGLYAFQPGISTIDLNRAGANVGYRHGGAWFGGIATSFSGIWGKGRADLLGGDPGQIVLGKVQDIDVSGWGLGGFLIGGYETPVLGVSVEAGAEYIHLRYQPPGLNPHGWHGVEVPVRLRVDMRFIDGFTLAFLAGVALAPKGQVLEYQYDLIGQDVLASRRTEVQWRGLLGIEVGYATNL